MRDLRIKAGLSQKSLAEKLNASQNAVSQLETGKLKPSVDMSIKLGQILGTPFKDLME
ncbi:MAG: helix-turn-helix domain-containing protein [Candidatus Adiutrix sp.]|nr:helix-turn-helix domain-containing protein [Candidatus Adiutrix sp.]